MQIKLLLVPTLYVDEQHISQSPSNIVMIVVLGAVSSIPNISLSSSKVSVSISVPSTIPSVMIETLKHALGVLALRVSVVVDRFASDADVSERERE